MTDEAGALLRRLEHAFAASPIAGDDQLRHLAGALTRLMAGAADPLAQGCAALTAWQSRHPLEESAVAALFGAVLDALHRDARSEPPTGPARALLGRLETIEPRLAHYLFRGACGWPPCPAEPALVAWLGTQRDRFAPVLACGLSSAPKKALALGDAAIRSRADWSAAIEAAGAVDGDVTIGRYAEARAVYDTKAYASIFDPRDRRNVHLGIDLGVPAGTAVHAPLEGTVHSFADNDIAGDYGPTIILEHRPKGLAVAFYTLYGHLQRRSLDGLAPRGAIARGERIGWIGEEHENGGWPPHLHFQIVTDMLGLEGNYYGVGEAGKLELWTSLCPDPNLILGLEL
ncbi:MAG TPA: peptidoglycan DD-metalloendopeptidase family protein [Gammaproteobacteria bacterium]|nr:peptidoglycan DD-metalloendopeptidase family protein [Gammaproteobacteria bacterium]